MRVFSNCYIEKFEGDIVSEYIILLNEVEEHNKQKYLLIVAQDINTHKTVKLIDTHGANAELCKYCDGWAKLKKGDIIRVKCAYYDAKYFANVLRIKSDYELIKSIDYYKEMDKRLSVRPAARNKKSPFVELFNYVDFFLPFGNEECNEKYVYVLTGFSYKKIVEYKAKDGKVKYQFMNNIGFDTTFADIQFIDSSIRTRVGKYYSGFVLMQIGKFHGRVRMKVNDFLNEDINFSDENPFDGDELPF